jgi:hypothetical protein
MSCYELLIGYNMAMKAIARTVRYTENEVHEIREYAELTGEQEASLLARASIRGLREERFERGLLAYLGGASSREAADVAGVDRHSFLVRAAERGVSIGDTEPGTLLQDLARVADVLGDDRLAQAVARVSRGTEGGQA